MEGEIKEARTKATYLRMRQREAQARAATYVKGYRAPLLVAPPLQLFSDPTERGLGGQTWPFQVSRAVWDNRYLVQVEDATLEADYSALWRSEARRLLNVVYRRLAEQEKIDQSLVTALPKKT